MKYWFVFCKSDLLLKQCPDGSFTIPLSQGPPVEPKEWTHVMNVGNMQDGNECKAFSVEMPITDLEGYEMCGLRKSFYRLPKALYLKAGKCQELLYWDRNTQFCGVCGAPMRMHTNISKRCTSCGKEVWPQLATAIIVRISKGDEILLVHAKNFASNFYGLVAGFVETGETLEEAVRREVREETQLEITNLRYFASQPWPYPCGLMVGFTAEYVSGDMHLQRSELSNGGWFNANNLPTIPEKLSIARMLIDDWLDAQK